jgi:hypothetical protein
MEEQNNSKIEKDRAEKIIDQRIFIIRDQKVMIDSDLAELYGVSTKRFNEQVKRNLDRFPDDFVFQLKHDEYENLRSQIATSSLGYGGRRYLPYVFTEHGVAMLSAVLNSKKAILMSIFIVRAFIKMRESLDNYRDLAIKIGEIELKQTYDHATIKNVHEVVKHLLKTPDELKKRIGFNE